MHQMEANMLRVLRVVKTKPSARMIRSQHVLELTDESAGYERRLRRSEGSPIAKNHLRLAKILGRESI